MTLDAALAFTFAFFLLAVTPGAGLAIILSRGLSGGMVAGLCVTTGLIMGDFVFISAALLGLSALATSMGTLFLAVKYLGAGYLFYLGVKMLLAANKPFEITPSTTQSRFKDIAMGLFVTLGNPKPILFYGAFLPSFLDLTKVGTKDFGVLMLVVALVSYGVYYVYLRLTLRAKAAMISGNAMKWLSQATGVMFIGSGLWVASK